MQDTGDTMLGRGIGPLISAHPEQSGLYPLQFGIEAFVARLVLAEAAEKSLDVQYYIWHGDQTGRLLTDRLLRAADRGVRVRVLLDDLGTAADDSVLLAIDAHPNIEVRLFNPVATRRARGLGALFDFSRVNRRMHNKSFTADNQATIVGGRNIGDEYFEARPDLDMGDLDVVAVGPVVREVSGAFDLYWNSPAAFPIAALTRERSTPESVAQARARLAAYTDQQRESPYVEALRQSRLASELRRGEVPLFWGRAWLVYDDPAKIATDPGEAAGAHDAETALLPRLKPVMDGVRSEVLVVSPYFVPGKAGVAKFREFRARGVKVRILTNSLAATDVAAVHAGYARYREALLRAGVELYEVKPSASVRPKEKDKDETQGKTGLPGSSRASLHAKSFVFDQKTLFVGSLNLDPRSIKLNTEIGVVFESAELAKTFAAGFEQTLEDRAWRLELASPSDIEWVTHENGREVRLTGEPQTSMWRRAGVWLLSLLPIEGQL